MRCWECGSENPPASRFCANCGVTTTAMLRPAAPPVASATPTEGERRHLTVLFSDLVDSTNFSSRLDSEVWWELLSSYQRAAADAVNRYGGYVAQFLGDGS